MDVREKLVDIFCSVLGVEPDFSNAEAMEFVEELITHGVTVQEWIPASKPPQTGGEYLCRCIVNDMDDMPFYMVLRYYIVDENPHFQHETMGGMKVTHWKPFDRLEKHKPMEMHKPPKGE